ncbi:hypothetical protein MRX96_006156 [Rhipicephalus microplus]
MDTSRNKPWGIVASFCHHRHCLAQIVAAHLRIALSQCCVGAYETTWKYVLARQILFCGQRIEEQAIMNENAAQEEVDCPVIAATGSQPVLPANHKRAGIML